MTIAVTGATGLIGRFIVERLALEGLAVRAWRRSTSDPQGLPSAVTWIEGDLENHRSADALVDGADMLVHSALLHEPGRFRGGEGDDLARFLEANVGGTLTLLAKARAAGVKKCVFISSRAVFGAAERPGPIGDGDPLAPDTNYGAAKAAVEGFVRLWGRGEGWPIAALRPTGVYGLTVPPEKSKWFGLVAAALRGEAQPPRAATEVHARDVAESVWRLLQAADADIAGRAFNCSDIVVSSRDIVRLVHRFAGASGPMPDATPEPTNVMECRGLTALGVRFGGWPLLEHEIAALVAAAAAVAGSPASSRRDQLRRG